MMTISTSTSKISYNGNGSTVLFTIPFYFIQDSDIKATKKDASDVETVFVLATDYTLSGEGVLSGGSLTTIATLASGESITIERNVALTQSTDYKPYGRIPADTLEQDIDKLTMISQQIQSEVDRTPKLETTSTQDAIVIEDPVSGAYLRYDANGNIINGSSSVENSDNYTYPDANALTRTLNQKMSDIISIADFGAVSDGDIADSSIGTDNTTFINNAILAASLLGKSIFIPAGVYRIASYLVGYDSVSWIGEGFDSSFIVSDAAVFAYMGDNCTIRDLHFYSSGGSGFILDDDELVVFSSCYFQGIGVSKWDQVIRLYTGDTVVVEGCFFKTCGYMILNEYGQVWDNIIVRDCVIEDAYGDFVEANTGTVTGKNITVTGCHFKGSNGFSPTSKGATLEKRFVGITKFDNVIITNNIIEEVYGDSAIHLESNEEHVLISNNIFRRCNTIYGYIQNTTTSKEVIISGNFFDHDTVTSTDSFITMNITGAEGKIILNSNKFFGREVAIGVNIGQSDDMLISSNTFRSCTTAIICDGATRCSISGNTVYGYTGGTGFSLGGRYNSNASIYGISNSTISNNLFTGFSSADYTLTFGAGSNMGAGQVGTDLIVSANVFDGRFDMGWCNNAQIFGNVAKFGGGGDYRNSINDWSGSARDQNSCQYANLQEDGSFLTATFYGSTSAPF